MCKPTSVLSIFLHCMAFTTILSSSIPSIDELSLDEKIGQLFMVATLSDFDSPRNDVLMSTLPYRMDPEYIEYLITQFHIGGLIYLGTSYPEKQRAFTNHYQQLSSIPLLIGQDFEWGLSMRLHDTIRFPKHMTLGALCDDQLIYQLGREIGRQMSALGVHINFAPVVDVNCNPLNPIINVRSFGQEKENVARKAFAYMRGLQDEGVMACAKHFPGHGDTAVDSHYALPLITHGKERLYDIELFPFQYLIRQGVDAVMVAHLEIPALESIPGLPSSLSARIVTTLLREELQFKGLIITDGLGMAGAACSAEPGQLELRALRAGNDILLCPLDVPQAVESIKNALAEGTLSIQELDEHVERILHAKKRSVFNEHCFSDLSCLNSEQAYALKKELYRHAVTLVRDNANLIPLRDEALALITIGTDIAQPFAHLLSKWRSIESYAFNDHSNDSEVEEFVLRIPEKTVIVAIHGMTSRPDSNYGVTPATISLLQKLNKQQKNIVVVPFGSPYSVALFPHASTIIMPYEDDEDAQEAAAEIMVGLRRAQGTVPI